MHNTCMPTKTISLSLEAYEKLRNARKHPAESFSHVVLRANWSNETITAKQLLELRVAGPALFSEDDLDAIERAKLADKPAEDKWTTP